MLATCNSNDTEDRPMATAELPSSMECVVCRGPGNYQVESWPLPVVEEDEVLVKVLAVGVCASDAKCFMGAPYYWGDKETPPYVKPPIIQGHEFIGEVVQLGDGAGEKFGLVVGDHVTSENIVPCWECRYCKEGKYQLCVPHHVYGWNQFTQGGMAEYMKFPRGAINYKVPRSIPAWQAAFIEPLACSIHSVDLADIQPSDTVVVAGCGPLGLGMVAAAKLKGPKCLIALDLFQWKLDIARKCGADVLLNPAQCDAIAEVKKLTEGFGCEVYIEASGHPKAVKQGMMMLAKGGRYVEYGVFGSDASLDWSVISKKELVIRGGHLAPNCYPRAISMLEKGKVPVEDIITHRMALKDAVEALKLVCDSSKSIKVVLLPGR